MTSAPSSTPCVTIPAPIPTLVPSAGRELAYPVLLSLGARRATGTSARTPATQRGDRSEGEALTPPTKTSLMNDRMTRRTLVRTGALFGTIVPLTALFAGTDALAQSPPVDPNDPLAKALGYVTVSPNREQKCANCMQYQGKPSDPVAGCAIFAGKSVAGPGWCKSWSKKG